MKKLLLILGALVLIVAALFFIPGGNFEVTRSVEINKPRAEVYKYIKHLKQQDEWSPWAEKDPNMEQKFTGTDGTVGFVSYWNSENEEVGEGEQEITNLVDGERIDMELRFMKPYAATNQAYLKTDDAGNGTKVTWGITGSSNLLMSMLMDMDQMVGPDFEKGLAKLKTKMEAN